MRRRWGIRNYWNGQIVAAFWSKRGATRAKYRMREQAWRYDVVRLADQGEKP